MGDPAVDAWQAFTRRIGAVGEALGAPPFPTAPADVDEGVRHLAEQVACWLGWSVSHADPRAPAFQRQNDLVTKWGGPNVDNVYRHARIDARLRYRVHGRMHGCEEWVLALRAGFMHMERWGTLAEVTASSLGIGEGDEFEFELGPHDGAIAVPDGAVMASFREYYWRWRAVEPMAVTIECLDQDPLVDQVPPPPVAARLDDAAAAVERSLHYWNDYLLDWRARQHDNTFGEPVKVTKGLDAARYCFCFVDLGPDEALVVELDVPDAPYWSLQLATLAWFESIDPVLPMSRNHTQVALDPDGRARLVVAHRDPGVPNWLATGGRPVTLLTLRWFWARSEGTMPSTRVVPLADVRSALPASTPSVSAAQRAEEVAARRRHLAWRFRT